MCLLFIPLLPVELLLIGFHSGPHVVQSVGSLVAVFAGSFDAFECGTAGTG